MKNGSSADIARPFENVFMVANDHVSVERSIVVEDELLHLSDDGSVGPKFCTVTEGRVHRMEFDGEEVEYEPPTRSAILRCGPAFDLNVASDVSRHCPTTERE